MMYTTSCRNAISIEQKARVIFVDLWLVLPLREK